MTSIEGNTRSFDNEEPELKIQATPARLLPRAAKETKMVGGLKLVRVKPGHQSEFESLFNQLRSEMHKAEPGCILYSLLKSRTDPFAYIVHEQYRDQSALDAHQTSPHGKIFFPKMRAIMESITVEYFDGIVE